MSSQESDYIVKTVPKNSKEVLVTSILNPYCIRVGDKLFDGRKKNLINTKLSKVCHQLIKHGLNDNYKPAVGDDVIVTTNYKLNIDIDLPNMYCRGVIMDTTLNTSNVFFLDDGITLNVNTEALIKYSRDSVDIEAFSYTIGINNILPADTSSVFKISKVWQKDTKDFVKQLIQLSSKIYFNAEVYDQKKSVYYGDLFLVLENKIVSLRKVLILSHQAILLSEELLQCVNNDIENDTMMPYKLEKNEILSNQNAEVQKFTNVLSLTDQNKNKSDKKQQNEKILIKGNHSFKPLIHIENSGFTSTVHETLKNEGVRSLKELQCYMWPAVTKSLNLVAIGSKGSGKTTGYIVPIISALSECEDILIRRQKNDTTTKPVVLILCASGEKCLEIATKCNSALFYHKSIKTFAGYDGIDDRKTMTQVCNKFQILISTVPFLLRILENLTSNKLILSELSYLVLDGADFLLNSFLPEIMTLIQKYKINNMKKKEFYIHDNVPMQIITVSETWTDQLCSFIDLYVKDPYICIGSYIEAAAYCRVQGRMLIRHSEKKKEEVFNALKDHLIKKTMIFCLDSEEATELNDYLKSRSIDTLLVHEKMPITQIQEIKEDWSEYLLGMYPVVICTDSVLSELEITDIQLLIHYSVTNFSKTQFNRRFSVLMDNWKENLKQYSCQVLILFDEKKENAHFKGITDILKRLKVNLPDDWSIIAEGLDIANNISKKNFPLCNSVLQFGKCITSSCPYRHRIVAEVDKPKMDISVGDELKLLILHVHNASHFSARIFECHKIDKTTKEKNIITYSYDIVKLRMKMNAYYKDQKNKRMQGDLSVGNVCALKSPENQYIRVQILKVVELDVRTNKPNYVQLRCIDDGALYEKSYAHELLEIPKEFLEYQAPVIDIYLMGLVPPDLEYKWSKAADEECHKWIKENKTDQSNAYAKVLLHIGNSVWTDSLAYHTKIIGFPNLISESINKVLRSKNHAVKNESHESYLLSLCQSGGLIIENNSNKIKEKEENI